MEGTQGPVSIHTPPSVAPIRKSPPALFERPFAPKYPERAKLIARDHPMPGLTMEATSRTRLRSSHPRAPSRTEYDLNADQLRRHARPWNGRALPRMCWQKPTSHCRLLPQLNHTRLESLTISAQHNEAERSTMYLMRLHRACLLLRMPNPRSPY